MLFQLPCHFEVGESSGRARRLSRDGAGTGGMPLVQREIAISAGPAVRAIKGTNMGLVGSAIRRASEETGLQGEITYLGNYSQNEI